jgi:YVTN family beta-propeller protein
LFYVANGPANTVSVIDATTQAVTNTITVGANPTGVAVNPVTNTVYVTNFSSESLSVINGATNAVTSTLTSIANEPSQVAVNPVTNKIYVLDYAGAQNVNVEVVDGATNTITSGLQVGGNASGVAVNTKTNTVYITNEDSLTVIDGTRNSIVTTVPKPVPTTPTPGSLFGASSVAVNETTNTVYVSNGPRLDPTTNAEIYTVSVINGQTNAIAATIQFSNAPGNIAVDPLTNLVYVATGISTSGNSITVINGTTNTVESNIGLTGTAGELAINTASNVIYMTDRQTVEVINGVTPSVP